MRLIRKGTAPGQYRFTAPFTFAFAPNWGSVPPFALDNARRFRSNAPCPVNSKRYAEDYDEVKRFGGAG